MRILLLAPQPFFQERGTPIAIRMLAKALGENGHEVDLMVYHLGEDVQIPGCQILRIPRLWFIPKVSIGFSGSKLVCDVFLFFSFLRRVLSHRYDVVHAGEESIFFALLIRFVHRAKVVYDMDSSMPDQLIEKWPRLKSIARLLYAFERRAIRGSDAVVPVCQALVERAMEIKDASSVTLLEDFALSLPGGDDQPVDDLRALVEARGPIALYVGNLEPYQGIDLALDAVSRLGPKSSLQLIIIGGSNETVKYYSDRARNLGIHQRCHFLGSRPVHQLAAYLAQADMLLSPRLKGVNTPMKIFTYLASARPILATRILSHTQVLDESTAVLVAADADAFAEGLSRLRDDPELRHRIGEAGQHLADSRYSYERFAATVGELYRFDGPLATAGK